MELFSGKTVYFGLTGQCKCQGENISHGEYLRVFLYLQLVSMATSY